MLGRFAETAQGLCLIAIYKCKNAVCLHLHAIVTVAGVVVLKT